MRRLLTFDALRPAARHLFYASPITEEARLDTSNPKWVQLCAAGSYVYREQPITITGETFDQIVDNFRAHPAYDPQARQLYGKPAAEVGPLVTPQGKLGVIALNFDHPPPGGPRPGHGWFLDVERRADQLWGLVFFDAEAYEGMCSGAWKWTSIEWTPQTTSPQGQQIGAYLSGVALTNDPFIQGMTPIQMSRRCESCERAFAMPGLGSPLPPFDQLMPDEKSYIDGLTEDEVERFAAYPWDKCIADQKKRGASDESAKKICGSIKAKNAARMQRLMRAGAPVVFFGPATDVLCALRECFGLPETADVGAAIGEIAKLRTWATGQAPAPLGVDVGALVADIRGLLNLPTLTDPANIFAELDKLLARLAAEQPEEEPMADPIKPPEPSALARELAPKLTLHLRRTVQAADADVALAFDAMSGKYDEAMGHVAAFKQMFGTDDAKAIADKIAALMQLGDQMKALLGEVAQEHEAEEKAEGDMAAQDVGQVMQAQRLDPKVATGTFRAYMLARTGSAVALKRPTDAEIDKDPRVASKFIADVRKRKEERGAAREAFLKEHGMLDFAAVQAALPMHLRGVLAGHVFAGPGAVFGPGNDPRPPAQGHPQQNGAPLAFGGTGQPYGPQPNAWTWSRVQNLPPGNNDAERVFAEVVRTEFNGSAPGGTPAYDRAWARTNDILSQVARERAAFVS